MTPQASRTKASGMRVMFSCTAGYGHFRPLVPLARAFEDAGHEVVFVTAASFAVHVERAGFLLLAAGIGGHEFEKRFAPFKARLLELPYGERRPLMFTWRFATIDAPAKLAELHAAVKLWRPDLLVHESADLAAPLVAASRGIPRVYHAFGRMVPPACFERAALETNQLWQNAALDPGRLGGVFGGVYVDICPPSLQIPSVPTGIEREPMRPTFPNDRDDELPHWVDELPDRPTVYLTLGTIFNDLAVFRVVLEALGDLDCNVIVTVGRNNDPAALAPVPANAVVTRFIAQSLLLARCALTVAHGGSGSALAALAAGVPMLLLPQGADQFENAQSLQELGAAEFLMPDELDVAAVHEAARGLLDPGAYREGVGRLAGEIATMPSPSDVLPELLRASGFA